MQLVKIMAPAIVLTVGLAGTIQAAGGSSQQGHSQMQQQGQMETLQGTVQKVEGDLYTIKSEQGKEMRLHIKKDALKGKEPKEGDKIQAKVMKGDEEYHVISAQRAGQGSTMQSQSGSGKQQGGKATKTITGEIKRVDGNVYYVQDASGKEIRLRLDQSAEQTGELKKGDKIEALVTKEKEFHVISAEPAK